MSIFVMALMVSSSWLSSISYAKGVVTIDDAVTITARALSRCIQYRSFGGLAPPNYIPLCLFVSRKMTINQAHKKS